MNVSELVKNISDAFATTANVRHVYGDPVTAGNTTIIPVAEIRYGFGAGGGNREQDEGGGGGGRMIMRPAGALEITHEGTRFIEFGDQRKLIAAMAVGFVLGFALVKRTAKEKL